MQTITLHYLNDKTHTCTGHKTVNQRGVKARSLNMDDNEYQDFIKLEFKEKIDYLLTNIKD